VINLPCERLLVIAGGAADLIELDKYLTGLRHKVASEIRQVTAAGAGDVRLARWAQTVLVLPATADILGMAANGIAADPVAALLPAAARPVVFAPAMREDERASPAVRHDVDRLRAEGHYVIEPVAGVSLTVELVLTHTMHVVLKQLRDNHLAEEQLVDHR